ncbi:trypanothione synthetase, putative [Ichthyophthirius multifiliis]|uniref:Trypanothione synthetase, putative n=1 Tax=Ichthyophthirius multifiliis TaxID=5932 RepID=G0QYJ3_ICHMU|nr:trypanothione synthetase, putative [Ichthyophthirius multifiliis]EGR29718.1 trypanothione synthetase, putative [Ichthyophthirius multifiliis]|eukprot:XP_004030954.1 trypanothione synthetase, putative [Ichthyophthirius multifiliis]
METIIKSKLQAKKQKAEWGTIICQFCQVPAYSNFGFRCMIAQMKQQKTELPSFYNYIQIKNPVDQQEHVVFCGFKYQCVELARRFMIVNQDVFFQDIDCAYHIFDLKYVYDIFDHNNKIEFKSFLNGGNVAPQRGDLIISAKSKNQPYGHVSVVVRCNIEEKYVDIIEQNYDDFHTEERDYTRRLVFEVIEGGRYYLYNKSVGKEYSKVNQNIDQEDSDEEGVIGWKRVDKPLKFMN